MASRSACLVALLCIVAAGGGYLAAAGAMPWPVPLVTAAVVLVAAGVGLSRQRRGRPASRINDDTEPAGAKPPPG